MKRKSTLLGIALAAMPLIINAMPETSNRGSFSIVNSISLGGPFYKSSALPLSSSCLKEMPRKVSKLEQYIVSNGTVGIDTLAKVLSIDLTPETGWGKYNYSDEKRYIDTILGDDYTVGMHYLNVIAANVSLDTTGYYGVDALNHPGAAAYNYSPKHFLMRCGDSYIHDLKMGAILTGSVLFHFNNRQDKKQFESALAGKEVDIFSNPESLKELIGSGQYSGQIKIEVHQKGGSQMLSADIWGDIRTSSLLRCGFDDIDSCVQAIHEFNDYAEAKGQWSETGFAKQVQINNGALQADWVAPVSLSEALIGSYADDFGLTVMDLKPSPEVLKARVELAKLYDHAVKQYSEIHAIYDHFAFNQLDRQVRNSMRESEKRARINLEYLTNQEVKNCFLPHSQDECPRIVTELANDLKSVDMNYFKLLYDAYFVRIDEFFMWVFVPDGSKQMSVLTTDLQTTNQLLGNNLGVNFSTSHDYLRLKGELTNVSNGVIEVNQLDYYGDEGHLYRKDSYSWYTGQAPWYACSSDECKKKYHSIAIVPF